MQKGWIKLHRKLLDNPIWQDPHYMKLWMYCLLQASHAEHEQLVGNQIIKLLPGQFVTGRISLAEEMNRGVTPKKRQSESTWWRDLKRFEEWGMLNIKANSKYSVVTVDNWAIYQETEKGMDSKRTADEQQVNSEWTASEQRLNTNKNVKNLRTKELENYSSTTTTPAVGIDSEFAEIVKTFDENLCALSPLQIDSLAAWFEDFNRDKEIIKEAIVIANDRNRKNFGFFEFLLKEWANNKLTTVEQVKSHERNKYNQVKQRQARPQYGKPVREEVVPEWMRDRDNERKKEMTKSSAEVAAEREELLKEINNNPPAEDIAARREKLRQELDAMRKRENA